MVTGLGKPVPEKIRKRLAKYLAKDEELIQVTGVSNLYFWSKFVQTLPLAILIIGIPSLLKLIHQKRSLTYILTNRRFLIIRGIFSRKLTSTPLTAITHITVEQSFSERFFYRSGQMVIITAGYDPREIVVEHIANPVEFKVLIEELTGLQGRNNQKQPFSGRLLRSLKVS